MFGDQLDLVVGFGKDAVYLAAGCDALQTLQQAIAQSEQPVVPLGHSRSRWPSSQSPISWPRWAKETIRRPPARLPKS